VFWLEGILVKYRVGSGQTSGRIQFQKTVGILEYQKEIITKGEEAATLYLTRYLPKE